MAAEQHGSSASQTGMLWRTVGFLSVTLQRLTFQVLAASLRHLRTRSKVDWDDLCPRPLSSGEQPRKPPCYGARRSLDFPTRAEVTRPLEALTWIMPQPVICKLRGCGCEGQAVRGPNLGRRLVWVVASRGRLCCVSASDHD